MPKPTAPTRMLQSFVLLFPDRQSHPGPPTPTKAGCREVQKSPCRPLTLSSCSSSLLPEHSEAELLQAPLAFCTVGTSLPLPGGRKPQQPGLWRPGVWVGESRDAPGAELGFTPLGRGHGGAGSWDLVRVRQEHGCCLIWTPMKDPRCPDRSCRDFGA